MQKERKLNFSLRLFHAAVADKKELKRRKKTTSCENGNRKRDREKERLRSENAIKSCAAEIILHVKRTNERERERELFYLQKRKKRVFFITILKDNSQEMNL